MQCRHYLLLMFFLLSSSFAEAQQNGSITNRIDSLKTGIATSTDPVEKARLNLQISDDFRNFISVDSSYVYSNAAINLIDTIEHPDIHAHALIDIGVIHTKKSDHDLSESFLDRAQEIIESHPDSSGLKSLYFGYGILYHNTGQWEKALSYNEKAILLVGDNHSDLSNLYYNRAIIFIIQEMYEPAKEYFQKSLESSQKVTEYSGEMGALKGLSYIASVVEKDFNSAEKYNARAQEICDITGSIDVCMDYYLTAAIGYKEIGMLDKAYEFYHKSLDYSRALNSDYSLLSLLSNCASIDSRMGKYQEAEEHFEEFQEKFRDSRSFEIGEIVYKNWAEMEVKRGNSDRAIELFNIHSDLRDSLQEKDIINAITDANEKYEAAEKEKELTQQQLSIEKKQRKIYNLSLGILFSILGMIMFYGFYRNAKQNELKAHQEISIKNLKIETMEKEKNILALTSTLEGQESERARIAHDLHDGLGGLLSSVKAHFSRIEGEIKQLESINLYEKAQSMMDNACDEVRRISHNLMPPLLRSQGLPTAIENLIQNKETGIDIQFFLDIRNMDSRLSETQEVFLYRITQELINNAMKHAQATCIEISLYGLDNEIQLMVEDNGSGFDVSEEGSGLGLSSVRSRVDYLQGELIIESSADSGTCITIQLPR